jgi:hypothetical protein
MIWVYVMRSDDNAAPCFYNNQTTVAICKPKIRRCAVVGDWLMGLIGKMLDPERDRDILWVGQISKITSMDDYHLTKRPDAIYKGGQQLPNPWHDQKDVKRDLSCNNVLWFTHVSRFANTRVSSASFFKSKFRRGCLKLKESNLDLSQFNDKHRKLLGSQTPRRHKRVTNWSKTLDHRSGRPPTQCFIEHDLELLF